MCEGERGRKEWRLKENTKEERGGGGGGGGGERLMGEAKH